MRYAGAIVLLVGLWLTTPLRLHAQDKQLAEKEKIEALIKNIENLKDATFVRNGSDYGSKMAARFLRGKWEAQGKDIKTATDFIEKIGSVSSTSRKPYLIRFKGGREIKCGEYLKEELKNLEKTPKEKETDRLCS